MRNIKSILKLFFIVMIITALSGFTPLSSRGEKAEPVYTMFVNDIEVGNVKYAAKGLVLYDQVLDSLNDEYNEEVFIEGDIFFREKSTGDQSVDFDEILKATIRQSVDINIDSYAVVINGEIICYVKTRAKVDEVLNIIQKPYVDNINELANVALQENISIEKVRVRYAQLVSVDHAVQFITVGEAGPREYIVKQGDTLWSIARAHDVLVSDLEAANPDLKSETIQIGQIINIIEVKSLVTVVTKEKHTYKETMPFSSTTQNDKNIYVGESKIVTQGRNGEKEIEVYITKENGREVEREILNEKIIKEPVTQVVAKGIKARPAPTVSRSGTTNFTRPTDLTPLSTAGVEMTPWSTANNLFPRGSIAKVTHLDTKLTFYVYRVGGSVHADVEPLTAADTAVMRKIYGSWSWDRNSIIVEVNGKKMAASMNGMPHGQYTIRNNNFNGHFCIHFLNSRTHGSLRLDPDHQAALKRVMQ